MAEEEPVRPPAERKTQTVGELSTRAKLRARSPHAARQWATAPLQTSVESCERRTKHLRGAFSIARLEIAFRSQNVCTIHPTLPSTMQTTTADMKVDDESKIDEGLYS